MNDTTTSASAAAAVDLISQLNDDVLLRILSLLPSARDVARTTVLSKRWRHLCGIAPCLRFAVGLGSFAEDDEDEEEHDARCHDAARRLIAGVDTSLVRRGLAAAEGTGGHDVDVLEILLVYTDDFEHSWCKREPVGKRFYFNDHHHEADITPSLVDSWLRFAEHHVTGSFVLELPLNAAAAAAQDKEEETREQDDQEEEVDGTEDDGAAVPEEEDAAELAAEEPVAEEEEEVSPPAELEETAVEEEEELLPSVAAEESPSPAEMEEATVEDEDKEEEEEAVELPASSRAEAMSLNLGGANTTVPIAGAGAFRALTDFTLCRAKINAKNNDDLCLGHLLSSPCCPRLRRLELRHIAGLIRLHLDAADTLEELRLVYLPDLLRLHVDAPGLRLLRVSHCDDLPYSDDPVPARVSAPRLEALAWDGLEDMACREFVATTTVRHLKKISLFSHGGDEDNVAAVSLLKGCTSVDHLELRLTVRVLRSEDTVKDIPHLPTVTKLRLDVNTWWCGHTVGATLARIIERCNNIEHLSIRVRGLWEEDQKIQLEHLKKVEFKGFIPFDDRKSLLRLLLKNASALEKITVKFDPSYIFENPKDKIDFDMPGYQGSWIPCDWKFRECGLFDDGTKYEWTREKPTEEGI
uniref:F-box domain-containing protein n=1 Tax=Oryza punctata TaxID=4537 RepID=A0A0E0MN30_ORYPU